MDDSDPRTIQSADTAFDIFEIVRDEDGITLSGLADRLDKAPSTVHQYLTTLKIREFVVEENNQYHLSHRFLEFGVYAREQNSLFHLAKPKVDQLVEETGERVQFSVAEYGRIIVLYAETGERAIRAGVRTGQRLPLHATAAGKAILAYYPPDQVERVIEKRGLNPVTTNTITNPADLREQLEIVREDGVAYNAQEDTKGLRAVGMPILDQNDQPLGALSVSGPEHRLGSSDYDREIRSLLRGAVNELELQFNYD